MRHFVIVGILTAVMTYVIYVGLTSLGLMPVQASTQAISIDWLWDWQVKAMSFLFALIVAPMLYSLVIFRRRKGESGDGQHFEGNYNLEIAWTVLPLFAVFAFAYMGASSLGEVRRLDPNAMVIKVHAVQWNWTFEYPEYGFSSDVLHLPLDRPIRLLMESTDVIHSFWVPEFRVKQDVVPGRVTELLITPDRLGAYRVRCAELCGTSHSYMEDDVLVEETVDFEKWALEQQAIAIEASKTPEGRGRILAAIYCLGCHSITSTQLSGVAAPVWLGLFGKTETLQDGSSVVVDEAYLIESILNPLAKIVHGFTPSMPQTFANTLSADQINDIIAFIKTLK